MRLSMKNKYMMYSPLTQVMYYILLALLVPLHGYGIIKKVDEMSNGRIKIAAGTLYGALSSLLSNGLIELLDADDKNKRRKTYQITTDGKKLLAYEIERLQEMVACGTLEMERENENS